MGLSAGMILEAAVLAASLSLDALAAGFAYGGQGIRMPMPSILTIDLVCAAVTGAAMASGAALKGFIPGWLTSALAFALLFIIGLVKLSDSVTKAFIRKHQGFSKEYQLSMKGFRLILTLYADPERADLDKSMTLSPGEAVALALSLSLDGAAVGLGAALTDVSLWAVVGWSLITNAAFLPCGHLLGRKAAGKMPANISWLGGAVLVALAFSKIL